jgi:hypothetical protein
MWLENVASSAMYSSAVYSTSQSYCRIAATSNSSVAVICSRHSGSLPGRGQVIPSGSFSPIESYTSWIWSKNGSPPTSGSTCVALQNAR